MNSKFAEDGFQIFPAVISKQQCDSLAFQLSEQFENYQSSVKNKIGGVRNLLQNQSVEVIATSPKLVSILEEWVGEELFPVRAIFFDKTTE
jgi:SHS2 domain-containing protein